MRADDEHRLYKRKMDDILTYLGDLGGLIDAMYLLGYSLTSVLASKLFRAALIGHVYKVQSYNKTFPQYYETKEYAKLSSQSSASAIENNLES